MDALLLYLLKSTLLLTLSVALFALLMQGETFHKLNRFALIAIMALSVTVPTINIGIETPFSKLFAQKNNIDTYIETTDDFALMQYLSTENANIEETHSTMNIDAAKIAVIIYLFGLIVLVIRQIIMYTRVTNIIKKGSKIDAKPYTDEKIDLRIAQKEIKPFSWLHFVMIDRDDLNEGCKEIITHEAAHCRAHHTLDIIFIDATILLQWFNPMAWLAKKWLKNIHEYEADEAVIKSGINATQYQQLIIKRAVGARLYSIANSFNHSSTLKRITMMCKKKSSMWRCAKVLYIIPTTAIAVVLFSQPEEANASKPMNDGEVTNLVSTEQGVDNILMHEGSTMPDSNIANEQTGKKDVSANAVGTQKPDSTKTFQIVEEQPQFPGGMNELMKFLSKNIKYPEEARKNNIGGKAFVTFVVKADGSIDNVEILKSSGNESLDTEAMRVVKSMPEWIPGKQKGEAVNTKFTLPIMFKLSPGAEAKPIQPSAQAAEKPLMVVDGVLIDENNAVALRVKEVESINVIQGESATKIWGNQAASGVIDIKRKKTEAASPDDVFALTEEMPQYPGGYSALNKFFTEKIKIESSVNGVRVDNEDRFAILYFIIEKDGSISNVDIVESKGIISKEAIIELANKMPKWQPGKHKDEPVRVHMKQLVRFN